MTDSTSILVKAGWLIIRADSPATSGGGLLISGAKIVFAGPAADVPDQPAAARTVDLSGCTVIPALIDAHVHLHMSGTTDADIRRDQLHCGYDRSAELIAGHLAAQAGAGVAALRDGGDAGAHVARFKAERDTDPVIVHTPGRAWRAQGRYGRLIGRPPAQGQSLTEAVAACDEPVDHLKLVNSGLNSLKIFGKTTEPQFSLEDLTGAAATAHELGLKVMVHANGDGPVASAVRAGCDSIEHGFFITRPTLELMARRGTVWTPTAVTMAGYAATLPPGSAEADMARRILDDQIERMALAREIGVTMAAGTDSGSMGVDHGRSLGWELRLMARAGRSPAEILASATLIPARLMGLDDRLGRLEAGLEASFIALPGPPDRVIANLDSPRAVWLAGRPTGSASSG